MANCEITNDKCHIFVKVALFLAEARKLYDDDAMTLNSAVVAVNMAPADEKYKGIKNKLKELKGGVCEVCEFKNDLSIKV